MKIQWLLFFALFAAACQSSDEEVIPSPTAGPQLTFALEFDENLPRLGNFGEAASIPAGHAAQTPQMEKVSLHYIELAPDALTLLGEGAIVYQGPETTAGGSAAVDFDQALVGEGGEQLLSVNLSEVPPGTYEWIRVSLTYQNYSIAYRLHYPPFINQQDFRGQLASFVGFNTYINAHTIADSTLSVAANKLQGYWAFESSINHQGFSYGRVFQGDGAGVTVVNPIADTSPVPAGSCVVTGRLREPLVISGEEEQDIPVVLAFSINQSFEWKEVNEDGKFEPGAGEEVVDMGLRGLHPYVEQ